MIANNLIHMLKPDYKKRVEKLRGLLSEEGLQAFLSAPNIRVHQEMIFELTEEIYNLKKTVGILKEKHCNHDKAFGQMGR